MINRYDNFTKLEEVVLGAVNFSMLDIVEAKDRQFFTDILNDQADVFSDLESILVSVPTPYMIMCSTNTYGKKSLIKVVDGYRCLDLLTNTSTTATCPTMNHMQTDRVSCLLETLCL